MWAVLAAVVGPLQQLRDLARKRLVRPPRDARRNRLEDAVALILQLFLRAVPRLPEGRLGHRP